MKKLFALLLTGLMVISAQGITMKWGSTEQVFYTYGDGNAQLLHESGFGGSIGIFFLGNDLNMATFDWSALSESDALEVSSELGKKATTLSTFVTVDTYLSMEKSGDGKVGDVWAVLFIYEDGSVSPFYTDAYLSGIYQSWYTFNGTENDAMQIDLTGNGGIGGGQEAYVFIPIPEPATALLAFAGIAMMICRRKKQK